MNLSDELPAFEANDFEKGDKVMVYDTLQIGVVNHTNEDFVLVDLHDSLNFSRHHFKCCRKFKGPREWWICARCYGTSRTNPRETSQCCNNYLAVRVREVLNDD